MFIHRDAAYGGAPGELAANRLARAVQGSRDQLVLLIQFALCHLSNRGPIGYTMAAGSPAMAINGYRNKPIGPGGGTRRLHHKLRLSRLPGQNLRDAAQRLLMGAK